MTTSLWIIAFACLTLTAVLFISGARYLQLRPIAWRSAPTDLLVLVAHPDDCVVLAGEYALWTRDNRMQVSIVYLTSGADDPASSRAATREREAIACWNSAGVPEGHLHFLRYRQSPMNGVSVLSTAEVESAAAKIREIVTSLAPAATVILPAAGEIHSDHRLIRHLGLRAICDSGRNDLSLLEAPEYNLCLSLVRSPGKVIQYLLKTLPLIWRLASNPGISAFPGFMRGSRGYFILDDGIHRRKVAMLKYFVSEDGKKLVRHFGFRNQFRPIEFPVTIEDEQYGPSYTRIGRNRLGLSVVGLLFSVYLIVIGLCWQLPIRVATVFPDALTIGLTCGALVAAFAFLIFWSRRSIESGLLYASASAGTIGGLIAYFN